MPPFDDIPIESEELSVEIPRSGIRVHGRSDVLQRRHMGMSMNNEVDRSVAFDQALRHLHQSSSFIVRAPVPARFR